MLRRVALVDLCALALLAACRPAVTPPAPTTPSAPHGARLAGPPVDLGLLAARARLAFQPDGAGGHECLAPGLRARSAADGALLLTPQDPARPLSAALRLGPARMTRGARAVDAGVATSATVAEAGGALVRRRGAALERLAGGRRGVELSWRLEARPAGAGDLVVRLATTGLDYLGASASGLHFGSAGAPGVRVGHATWIDAAGRATPVPAAWRDGEIRLAVPAAVVDASAYPAVLDPLLSPEADLDVPLVGPATGAQGEPSVATDGTGWLVAWTDQRAIDESWVVAARVAADGTVLDPTGLVVASGPGQRRAAAVAAGGGTWLVAWQELLAYQDAALRAARIGVGGALLDPSPIGLDSAPTWGDPVATAAAFDGTAFRIAWSVFKQDADPVDQTCGLRLAGLDGAGRPASPTQVSHLMCAAARRPTLACSGEPCLVAWSGGDTMSLGLFDGAGRAIRRFAAAGSAAAAKPSAASTGTGFLVAYQRLGPTADQPEVAMVRVMATGDLDGLPIDVAIGGRSGSPALAFDGSAAIVAWEEQTTEGSAVIARRFGLDGTPLDEFPLAVAAGVGSQSAPSVAAMPSGALVAFVDTRTDPAGDVRGARLLPGGLLPDGEGLLLSGAAPVQRAPAAAFDGTHWLVVFEGERGPGLPVGVLGLRLATDLTPLDATPFAISAGTGAARRPTVAGCAGGFLVSWEDYTFGSADVLLAAVPAAGPPAPPAAVASGSGSQTRPALACGPAGGLLAWYDGGWDYAHPPSLRAARLTASGAVRDAGGLGLSVRAAAMRPAVAAGPGGFAVAWQEVDSLGHTSIAAVTLGGNGAPSAPAVACAGPDPRGGAVLSADATGYQVSFFDARTGSPRLRSARLDEGGAVLDPCGVELAGSGLAAGAAFDGARHTVVFERQDGGVGASQVTPGGGALGGLEVAAPGGGQRAPAVVCDGRGRCLVATERTDLAAGTIRVRIRRLESDLPAPRCDAAGDCASGFCVDGVCCDEACGGGDPTDCRACSVAAGAPADGTCAPAAVGRLCRAGTACDASERCDGSAAACPADVRARDGSPCDDGDACTRTDACLGGACVGADPVTCVPGDTCSIATCHPDDGRCWTEQRPAGTACDDGNPCTIDDTCPDPAYGTSCRGTGKLCPASACHSGVCNQYTGACAEVPWADGASCGDGSACTVSDHCVAGACVAGPAVRCPPPDACHQAGLCDRASGACVYAVQSDGAACDDGDACTRHDACSAGTCAGSDPVPCPGADACHAAGACDPASGACAAPVALPDAVDCDDGNACTRHDACAGGTCTGGDPVRCPAADACREAGMCNPATGACSAAWRPAGTPCDDGDPCTSGDACAGGTCQPGTAPACPAPENPCLAATCAPDSGSCGTAPVEEGAPCPGGQCRAGACAPAKASGGCASGGEAGALALLGVALAAWRRRDRLSRAPPSAPPRWRRSRP